MTAKTVDEVLRQAIGETTRAGERALVLDPAFQGLPGMVHGGTVLALFDALAGGGGAQHVAGHYMRRVPLATPLTARVSRDAGRVACSLRDAAGTLLVDGHVTPAAPAASSPGSLARDGDEPARHPLPVSATCFVCGLRNDLGLQARLAFDETVVRGAWSPRAPFARPDGSLAPAALTSLLDEAAFWLGALATGESGMTTELAVTLHRAPAFGAPVTVVGARERVAPRAEDPRYCDTDLVALDNAGRVVATAQITFVAVRGAARRLVTGMLAMNPPEILRRVFPAYVPR